MKTETLFSRARWMGATVVLTCAVAAPDAAFACRPEIGNFVWLDTNENGLQDAGEPGIAGVRVTLESLDGTVLQSVLTDDNGYYLFTSSDKQVPPFCEQTYVVKAETPGGLTATSIEVGGDRAVDSNDPAGTFPDTHDYGPPTNPWGVPTDLTIDFGFVPVKTVCTGQIGDFVWNDLNNNGRQDAGEPGIGDVVVTLNAGSGQATSAAGGYLFSDLCAGTYTVCADVPVGFQPSPANASGVPVNLDSNGTSNGMGLSCASVTLPSDVTSDWTIDFGFWKIPVTSPGTGTPGYWKNHASAWPVDSITIGGIVYSKAHAIQIMELSDGDKTVTMFRSLVAAKLNVLIGNDASCIGSTISAADDWMAANGPVGSGLKAKSVAWKVGEPLYWELDAYNNGNRCAPSRD